MWADVEERNTAPEILPWLNATSCISQGQSTKNISSLEEQPEQLVCDIRLENLKSMGNHPHRGYTGDTSDYVRRRTSSDMLQFQTPRRNLQAISPGTFAQEENTNYSQSACHRFGWTLVKSLMVIARFEDIFF